jgi:hypothetical protein
MGTNTNLVNQILFVIKNWLFSRWNLALYTDKSFYVVRNFRTHKAAQAAVDSLNLKLTQGEGDGDGEGDYDAVPRFEVTRGY